jgi:hypothetical protein
MVGLIRSAFVELAAMLVARGVMKIAERVFGNDNNRAGTTPSLG